MHAVNCVRVNSFISIGVNRRTNLFPGAAVGIYSPRSNSLAHHPNSETVAIKNIPMTTNVGNPGVWIFQISPSGKKYYSYILQRWSPQ